VTHSSGIMTLNSPGGSTLQCGRWLWDDMPWNSLKRPPYWNSTSDFDLTISPQSTCHSASVGEILSKSDHPQQQEKMMSCRFSRWRISAILDFSGPIMGSLKSPCTTSHRSSIALNCLVFEKITFLQFGDRQTNKQTNRWTCPLHEAALAITSCGLIKQKQIGIEGTYIHMHNNNNNRCLDDGTQSSHGGT